MNEHVRMAVRERAQHRCEYCHRDQASSPLIPLQVEHIRPKKHGGSDALSNLALACSECNLYKGSNLAGIDPVSDQLIRLFHPREDDWVEHFRWNGWRVEGLTAIGRVTIAVLKLNASARVRVRRVTGVQE